MICEILIFSSLPTAYLISKLLIKMSVIVKLKYIYDIFIFGFQLF